MNARDSLYLLTQYSKQIYPLLLFMDGVDFHLFPNFLKNRFTITFKSEKNLGFPSIKINYEKIKYKNDRNLAHLFRRELIILFVMTKKPPRPKSTRSKTRTVRARTPNGYIYFYKIYSKLLKNDNPQLLSWQIGRLTGQIWREQLPYNLKNEFIKYAKDEYKIRNFYSTVVPPSSTNIINFDLYESSSEEELLFEKYIQYPPNPLY